MKHLKKTRHLLARCLYKVAEWIDYSEAEVIDVVQEIEIPKANKGRVVKATARAEYSPDAKKIGVVKVMPRQLQKIKKAQELKVDDL